MEIVSKEITVATKARNECVDITEEVEYVFRSSGLKAGTLTVFVVGSTAAITTFEYESGLIKDMQELYEKIAPSHKDYHHDDTWGDANGSSHVRAALQGPSLTIPFADGTLLLGTWQQIVLVECDVRPRQRRIVVQIIGI